jgi:hypothetical protein
MPQGAQTVDMTNILDKPTLLYLVFPLTWERIENDSYVSPKILDPNGYE